MSNYIVSCCSTADLSKEMFEKQGIHYAKFNYYIDGKAYKDDLYQTISSKEFFDRIAKGAEPTTAQLSPGDYLEFWEPFLKDGKDILHLALSSGISGTFQSAHIAVGDALERYPERKIEVVDSLAASSGFGLLVVEAKNNADNGMSLEDNAKWVLENRNKLHHWFFSTDLSSYIRGGRVSRVSGFFGTLLNICPLLNVNNEGKLIPRYKIRSKKKVIQTIFEKMKEHARDGANYTGKVYISHSDSLEDAMEVKKLVEKEFKNMDGEVVIFDIGTVIGAHTGPGTVALFFWGDEREA